MARKSPGLIQMICSTTGNGPYTLANPLSPIAGKRTIAQAVADGSLVNGEEILFVIRDATAFGNGKLFEHGKGTINTTTLVLTVLGTYEKSLALSSGGGWGAGTRDVYIAPVTAFNAAFIDLANIFIENQTIEKSNPALLLRMSGNTRASLNFSGADLWLQYFNATGVLRGQMLVGETNVWQHLTAAGAVDSQLTLGAGTLEWSSGVGSLGVARFPHGGVFRLISTTAPPTGWTRVNNTGEPLIRLAGAADTVGATGGSWTISGLATAPSGTDPHTLTVAQMPTHTHVTNASDNTAFQGGSSGGAFNFHLTNVDIVSGSAGSDQPHSHGIPALTVSSTGAWRPFYKNAIEISFD